MRATAALLLLAACARSGGGEGAPDAQASPQASAMPAPLAPATPSGAPTIATEGGPPPVPFRGDVSLPDDSLGRETVAGYTLSAVFRQANLPVPLRAPEVASAGLDAARKRTELRVAIDLGASRMRAVLLGEGFVLPAETELRARGDRYGHLVVPPGAGTYRPLAPGSLRALLGERRFDVAPIAPAELVNKDEVGKRIGVRTRRVDVATRAAKATFEVGRIADLGDSGVLLCRLLLNLMNAPPGTALCTDGELPMRAELRWTGRGSLAFEVTGVLKKADIAASWLLVPPAGASFAAVPLTAAGVAPMLSPAELTALRTGPVEVPPAPGPPAKIAVTDGLEVANATEQLRVLYVDGVPAAWAAPATHDVLHGLLHGKYVVQWRSFLGDVLEPPVTLTVPGTTALGPPDAGVR